MQKKNVIIFGGSGTLGKEILYNLANENFNIVFSSRIVKKSHYKGIKKSGVIKNLRCDVSDEKSIKKFVISAYKLLKNVDFVIDCTGIFYYDKLKNINTKTLLDMFNVNIFSTILINKYIEANKPSSKWVKIITCGSSSAVIGAKDTVSYCASKHALVGAIKSLNQTVYKKKIINYCLNFGTLDSKMSKQIRNTRNQNLISQQDVVKSILYLINLGKHGLPEELYLKRFN
jgi:short-subunit dehydrogenase